jgi:hypothetical protein
MYPDTAVLIVVIALIWLFAAVRGIKRAVTSIGRPKWMVVVLYLLLALGGEGFFAQSLCTTGVIKLPPSFQWPAGYVSGVTATEDGKQVVPLTPVSRVQIYDAQWRFVTGWYVNTGGGDFKVQSSPGGLIEVFTARGRRHYSFSQDGHLISSGGYSDEFSSLPGGESLVVPTSPFLWIFSSPFLSWAVGMIGLAGLLVVSKIDPTVRLVLMGR